MTPRSGIGTSTDELLLGVLLAVAGVAVGSSLNSELGTAFALLGLLVGVGAYVVSALSVTATPSAPTQHGSPSRGTNESSETEGHGDA